MNLLIFGVKIGIKVLLIVLIIFGNLVNLKNWDLMCMIFLVEVGNFILFRWLFRVNKMLLIIWDIVGCDILCKFVYFD